ncbi:MAG: outer membrane lipoprotein carrier protein LolA [Bacteroidales bacterium]|nr:outer membrane lipoprotein carrier protein LolA [Bacteroidales bacterium]
MLKNKFLYHYAILFFMICFIPGTMKAQGTYKPMKEVEAFRENMNRAAEKTASISSDFEQLKHLSFLEEDVTSTGRFYFQKEHKLRWEYSSPFFYLIIFNNDTVLIRDSEKTSVYDAASGQMFRQINDIMLRMVNGTILESKDFEFEYLENDQYYKLDMVPLDENMKEFLSGISLFINKDDYTADELLMLERSGDFTRIRFINKRLNENIPEHIFDLP